MSGRYSLLLTALYLISTAEQDVIKLPLQNFTH
jgi:hypothetical protein